MNKYKSISEIKRLAKGQLLGNYGKAVPILLLHLSIPFIIQSMSFSLFTSTTLVSTIIQFVVNFIESLIVGILVYGECFVYLKNACHFPIRVADIFYGFHFMPDKIIKTQFILSLITNIVFLPNTIFSYICAQTDEPLFFTVYSLSLIAGYTVNILINLHLALVYYLMLDFPDYSVKRLFSSSCEIMRGNKMRLFKLTLSFFPVFLLGIISLGIGFLWIIPYFYAAKANFYLDIMSERNKSLNNI